MHLRSILEKHFLTKATRIFVSLVNEYRKLIIYRKNISLQYYFIRLRNEK